MQKKRKDGGLFMFFLNCSSYEGQPVIVFREPDDIRRDIYGIKQKIKSANERLNVRAALMEIVTRADEGGDPTDWIRELKLLCEDAEDAVVNLNEMKSHLEGLTLELEDTLCLVMRG